MTQTATLAGAPADRPAAGDETLRDRLRAETREPHEALDARFAAMMGGERAVYARFLAMNRDAHAALEPLLARSPLGETWRADGRLAAARRDCDALGLAEPAAPSRFERAELTRAEAFGVAYVLEGSRLGAKFLLRGLARDPARNSMPTHYLQASSDAGPFAGLLRSMAETGLPRDEFDASVEAARATFRFFGRLADRYETAGTSGT